MTTERIGCGEPRATDAGRTVTVYGWVDRRRDLGGLIFIMLRDRSGVLQIVVDPVSAPEVHRLLHEVRQEWVLEVRGRLVRRSPQTVNPRLPTGEVELRAERCRVLSVAATPPFAVNEDDEVDERLRLRYRYLDLRRPRLQRNLQKRARFVSGLRRAMEEMGFVEIETPLLVRATPEGARDYLVPSRLWPGRFYALPQSPQLYKQLCMVAGLDRYYQIARCLRDEDLRADRQPEFTQLDLEMSFVDEEDVFAVLERALSTAWSAAEFRGALPVPFPRITWEEAMARYGTEKPDLRFGMELCDLTDLARTWSFRALAEPVLQGGVAKAIVVPGGAEISRRQYEGDLTALVRAHGARGLAHLSRRADGWEGPIAKFFESAQLDAIAARTAAGVGDSVCIVADRPEVAGAALGALRVHLARQLQLYDPDVPGIVWVTDFPMFEPDPESGGVTPLHHPFTMVRQEDLDLLETDPLRVRSRAYDIVLNGREVGSGSIRITDPDIQQRVFSVIGIGPAEAAEKFGFLLEAFRYGVPPHGGFAAGIDRLVMEGLGEESIREVVAFPKTQQAQELMTGAPAPVDPAQLAELGIAVVVSAPASGEPEGR